MKRNGKVEKSNSERSLNRRVVEFKNIFINLLCVFARLIV